MKRVSLDEVFNPRGVALVGLSEVKKSTFASGVLESLKKAGYPAIYPVNPKYHEAFGLPCYPSVSAIPGVVDHVVVSIPSRAVLDLLEDCGRKGVKSVQFFTAGFSESGNKQGIELEKAMLQTAKEFGFRIMGPNCVGMYVPGARFAPDENMSMQPGGISFLSQSGGYAYDLPLYGALRGLRFSKVISYGNAIDIDECELLDYFFNDAGTKTIGAYIEGVRRGREFSEILRRNVGKKPVVLFKGGVTSAGMRAAQSHTASLTSSVEVFNALCRQYKVIQVSNLDEMMDALVVLNSAPPLPCGKNVVVMGVGGGPTVMASDQIEAAGLNLPALPPDVKNELGMFLQAEGSIFANPIDAFGLVIPDVIAKTMSVLASMPDVDSLIFHMGFHPASGWGRGVYRSEDFIRQFIEIICRVRRESSIPIMVALGPWYNSEGLEEKMNVQEALEEAKLPFFFSIKDAAMAIGRIEKWNRFPGC